MREILRTSSVSLAQSLRLALEAEDIPVLLTNDNLAGLPPVAISVAVVDDTAYERGAAILKQLQQATTSDAGSTRRLVWVFAILGLLLFGVFCGVFWP